MDLKRVFVLRPTTTGAISFAIAPNSHGALVMYEGSLSTSQTAYNGRSTTSLAGWTVATMAAGTDCRGAISDPRLNALGFGWGDNTANTYNDFRNIVCVADVSYTGTSLNDSGTVQVDHISGTFGEEGSEDFTYSTNKVQQISICDDVRPLEALTNIGTGPRAVAMEARKPFTVRVPGDVRYKTIKPTLYISGPGTVPPTYGYLQPNASNGTVPGPVYQDSGFKLVSYSGLNAAASVTVTLRYCIQLTVDPGTSMYTMSQPSPPRDLPATTWYERFRSVLPTAEKAVTLGLTAADLFLPRAVAASMRPVLKAIGVPGAR